MNRTYQIENLEGSLKLGEDLSKLLKPGMVIRLEGDLGAGKTTFTKGIGAGLGIDRVIKSPTYTIIREYLDGTYPLYHMDLYRLDEEGVLDLGLEEYFYGQGISVIEWGSNAPDELPDELLLIEIFKVDTESDRRQFTFKAYGQAYQTLLEDLDHVRGN